VNFSSHGDEDACRRTPTRGSTHGS